MMSDDINREILGELRKFRKISQLQTWLAAVCVIAALVFVAQSRHERARYSQSRTAAQQSQPRPWDAVHTAMDRHDFPKALSLAQALADRQTNYYYGHVYLGNIYLALNDAANAEAHYLRAYELWPDKENEKNLVAIRKRLDRERALSQPK